LQSGVEKFETNPFSSFGGLEFPPRMKTFDPSSHLDNDFTVEYPSERILLRGLSFDYVSFNNGYMVPRAAPEVPIVAMSDIPPVKLNISLGSIPPCVEDKDEKSVDVLPNEITANSSVKEEHSETINSCLPRVRKTATLNVERNIKTLVRLLRKSLKRQFDDVYNKKHYYWNGTNLRKRTLKFFTELSNFEVPCEFYLENEEAFFKLIHNTYDNSKHTQEIGECMKHMPITDLFKEVFG
jgi:hypothetical protein